ncbi:MAG: esterase [Puniceicoccaceae bacterium 5H]|nr:MAG: esterase [Puniceicoccaceae bacterium 5H]
MNTPLRLAAILTLTSLTTPFTSAATEKNTYSVAGWWDSEHEPFSPVIHEDRSVTFRVRAPDAASVTLALGEWTVEKHELQRGEDGVWSVTVDPLEPEIYGYNFIVDGLPVLDRTNPNVKAGTMVYSSLLEIPGEPPRFYERQNVPQGVTHIHHFDSTAVGEMRSFYVHTPPGYDPDGKTRYPVLYLRHGGGDHAGSWSAEGRAGVILDNLIAKGEAEPMIIVMPYGLLDGSWASGSTQEGIDTLEHELFDDIAPIVQQAYRIEPGAQNTAIAGLSMGGGQAFLMGLHYPERFDWIGDFSSGLLSAVEFDVEDRVPGLLGRADQVNRQFDLIYLACGSDDPRILGHREFAQKLRDAGIEVTFHEMPGGHEWSVWRHELRNFLQRVFQPGDQH